MVTQTYPDNLKNPFASQTQAPLAFLGGTFKGFQTNLSTYKQEGFAILKTFDKLDYLFLDKHPVHVLTDHRNLLFVVAPLALQPALGQQVVDKFQRWAVFLSIFEYTIEHIPREENILAEMLTRWAKGYRKH